LVRGKRKKKDMKKMIYEVGIWKNTSEITIENVKYNLPSRFTIKLEFLELTLNCRLNSTRGGGTYWHIAETIRPFLSNSPYCPTLNIKITDCIFKYVSGIKKEERINEIGSESYLVQQMDESSFWIIQETISTKIEDLSLRLERKDIIEAIEKTELVAQQGNLTISKAMLDSIHEKVEEIVDELGYTREFTLYNHHIVLGDYHIVIPFDNKRLVLLKEDSWEINTTIWAKDHPPQSLGELTNLLFTHPIPTDDRD
jgi:hypothetical protein